MFHLSERKLLQNFLTFLEIFMNEERKQRVSYGDIPLAEISKKKVDSLINLKKANLIVIKRKNYRE
jgi:hypothetical protein